MPFASQQQARWAHATDQPWAKRWADETDFAKLPKRVRRIRSKAGLKGCTCKAIRLKGEQIAPGITRIHGNLCNVHGRYGPCDAAASGKKPKGGKGRAAKKPVKTPEQRQQERAAEQAENRTNVLQRMNIAPDGQQALEQLRNGEQPTDTAAIGRGGFEQAGLVERGRDGNYRLTSSGRAMLGAADQGDFGRAGATVGAARDRVSARQDRQSAAQDRKRQSEARRKKTEQRRQAAADKRKQAADARAAARAESTANRSPRRQRRKEMQTLKAGSPGDYLVVEDRTKPGTWHLQVKRNGKPDHGLMGGAWAALHPPGYRGNEYSGPNKADALKKLRALYAAEKMPLPSEKEWSGQEKNNQVSNGHTDQRSQRNHTSNDQYNLYGHNNAHISSIPPSFTVFKDASGADRWVSISSTAYKDRDQEIVSTKALQRAVALADASGYRGPLRFWHVPGVEIGDCDFQATAQDGRFLIESGTFRSPALAAAVKERASGYQVSIGFTHPATEPDTSGVFSHIAIFERSLVPKGRASNPFTQVAIKELRMSLTPEKAATLKDLLGGDDALFQSVVSQIASTDKAAQAGGVAYKDAPAVPRVQGLTFKDDGSVDTVTIGGVTYAASAVSVATEKAAPTESPVVPTEDVEVEAATEAKDDGEMTDGMEPEGDENFLSPAEISAIASAVVQAITPLLDIEKKMAGHLNEMKGLIGTVGATKDTALAEVKTELASVKAQVADLSGSQPRILSGGYRASQSAATVTTDETKLKDVPASDPVASSFSSFMTDLGFGAQPHA